MHAAALIRSAAAEPCRPWPRHIVGEADWATLARALDGDPLILLALWADTTHIHALFLDENGRRSGMAVLPVSTAVEHDAYPALSASRPEAAWYERMIQDLWGHVADGAADLRPWLDHGHWPVVRPLSPRPMPPEQPADRPEFNLPVGPGMMHVPIGPIWGLAEEAAHLRLAVEGNRIVRAESRLGYAHKGTLALMRGKSPRAAARFAARLSADATVAHSMAFAQATEAALDVTVPDRTIVLRAAMAEIERIAGHLGDLAEQARLAGADGIHARFGVLREALLRATEVAFGHRMMMDCVVPGGVVADITTEGRQALLRAAGRLATDLPGLRQAHEGSALAARLGGIGTVRPGWASRFSAGGVVGRAAGRAFDARDFMPLYDEVGFWRSAGGAGDAGARAAIRLAEIGESLRLLGMFLERLPQGAVSVALPATSGEGIGCAESIRGDVWHWLRLDHGQIASVFPRDPGWALWPLCESVLRGESAEDVALIRCSLGLPGSGMDL